MGIDPGSRFVGLGLLGMENNRISYMDSDVIKVHKLEHFFDRITHIKHSMQKYLVQHRPHMVAMESLIFVKNPLSMFKLAQSRGVILSVLLDFFETKDIYEYGPNQVKLMVAQHGHSNKEGIQFSLAKLFGKETFKTDDESDALAVALCHILQTTRPVTNPNQEMTVNGSPQFSSPRSSQEGASSKKSQNKNFSKVLEHLIK